MNEEEAIFVKGKALSELRNSGEDLPTERILVGSSWVLPMELADEYDKRFPPGPRRRKQVTDKVFCYELDIFQECRGESVGLRISHLGRSIDVLRNVGVFACNNMAYKEQIKTSLCNRYDVIEASSRRIYVIDKLDETISVAMASFRVDDVTSCAETPIAGTSIVRVMGKQPWGEGCIAHVHFPFIAFDRFWTVWNGYVEFRKRQIAELKNVGTGLLSGSEG